MERQLNAIPSDFKSQKFNSLKRVIEILSRDKPQWALQEVPSPLQPLPLKRLHAEEPLPWLGAVPCSVAKYLSLLFLPPKVQWSMWPLEGQTHPDAVSQLALSG